MPNFSKPVPKSYIPKSSSQQDKFLKKYSNFDGRGILIAIIDTSVDVSLPGLQKTATGLPKIIDCFDFTGNGNVDTSMIKKIDSKDNILIGLTGRQLKIPSKWINPSGIWHLGIKSIYELFDDVALERIINLRKEQICIQNKVLEEEIQKTMENKEDLKFMLEYLKSTENLSKDSLVAGCIVWHDGKKWQACVDTSFFGDLENVKIIANYRDEHEFGLFFDEIAFCVTIKEDGNLLEIFVPFKDHGTLVANIAAAHYPDEPEKDGLAPGAQIISMAVLDPQNNGALNEKAAIKAFQKCLEMKVNIINYSIARFPEGIYPIMIELAEKHGVIICKSAGNNGPVFSSICNIPSNLLNMVFIIGSCDTPNIKSDDNKLPTISSFSSRGPMPSNGSYGPTFLAPGYGITDKPKYYSSSNEIFHATSFSTPNASGAIACLISALKSKNISINPFKLKIALANTALKLKKEENSLSYGNGIIQIYKAFKYLETNLQKFPENFKNISFLLSKRVNKSSLMSSFMEQQFEEVHGIFLKIQNEQNIYNYDIKIVVQSNDEKQPIDISWKLQLSPEAGKFADLSPKSHTNEFSIEINTSFLKPDNIYYAEICGTNSSNPSWGILFKFPITVILPKHIQNNEIYTKNLNFDSNKIHRIFFFPPTKSYQCLIKITALEEKNVTVKFHHIAGNRNIGSSEEIEFTPEKRTNVGCLQLEENTSYEFCIYQENGVKEFTSFNVELDFYGFMKIDTFCLSNYFNFLPFINNILKIQFKNDLKDIKLKSMSLEFHKFAYYLEPSDSKFETINEKHYLSFYYTLKISKPTKCKFDLITFGSGTWCKVYTLQKVQIFTYSKKFIMAFGDNSFKKILLQPGTYIIKATFEYDESQYIFIRMLSYCVRFPVIKVTTFLEKESLKPILHTSANHNLTNVDGIIFQEFQKIKIFYNLFSKIDMLSSFLPFISKFKGKFTLKFENTSIDFKVKHKYYNYKHEMNRIGTRIKEYIQSFLPYSNYITKTFTEFCDSHSSKSNMIQPTKMNSAQNLNLNNLQKIIKTACNNFAEIMPNSNDIQKELILIKEAITFGNFGIALFYLNKLSIENQTIPESKTFDKVIIEILKQLKWKHLIEAHENAFIDRHRNYYRKF